VRELLEALVVGVDGADEEAGRLRGVAAAPLLAGFFVVDSSWGM